SGGSESGNAGHSSRGAGGSKAGDGDAAADSGTTDDASVRTRSERDAERRRDHPLSDVWGDG
ncbi:hypothetical protein DJ68_01245, partial [Halorubrum sp. C3]